MRQLLRGIYLAAHLSVLVLFAAGFLGRYVHPHTAWWLQPIAIVLPLIAVFVLALTPVAVMLRAWALVGISVAALLLFGLRYVSAAGGSEATDGPALTVATLNTRGGVHNLDGGDRGLPALIESSNPDVLSLQEFSVGYRGTPPEAHTYRPVDAILDRLGYEIIAPRPPEGHRGPPPILTKVTFEQSSVLGLSTRNPNDPAGVVVRAQLNWQGHPFVVYNVHLQSFTTDRPWRQGAAFHLRAWLRFLRRTSAAFIQRADEAEEIRGMLEREELPFLLCGDFNSTPHQWVHAKLAAGLKDAYRSSGGFWGPTFPSSFPLVRIDYVLASSAWRVLDARVGPAVPSDHRPVIVRLAL